MENIKLLVEPIYDNTTMPNKPKCETDSGFDIYAYEVKKIYSHHGTNAEIVLEGPDLKGKFIGPGIFELQCNERCLIGTGFKATIGEGFELQIRPRSGNALKRGLTVLNAPGTVN